MQLEYHNLTGINKTVYNFMIEEQNTQFSKHHVSRCFTITEAYNPSFLIPEPDVLYMYNHILKSA